MKKVAGQSVAKICFDDQLRREFCERLQLATAVPQWHLSPRKTPRVKKDSAVLIPLIEVDGCASVLFTHRSRLLMSHRGEVSFPGGRIEPGENAEQVTSYVLSLN